MATRRSTRTRARGVDQSTDSTDSVATGESQSPPARAAKRARTNRQSATVEAVPPPEWIQQTLTEDKRTAWDGVFTSHFHLHKPHELYDLYELAVHLRPEEPLEAFVASASLRLMGPFQLLAHGGRTVQANKPIHLHGRYSLDPPEVVTVLEDTESTSGAHWGLYRDKPKESPSYVVHAEDASVCAFEPVAPSVFTVLRDRLQARSNDAAGVHLKLVQHYLRTKSDLVERTAAAMRNRRSSEITAPSLHGLGIVVPYDAKKQSGFRELPIVGEALRELFAHVQSGDATAKKKLTHLLTRATIANDECDFGTSLLLGLDLFTTGSALQKEALQMLRVAYMLLGRKQFATVASDHLRHRIQGLTPLDCLLATESDISAQSIPLP